MIFRFPLREQVRQANETRLARLPGDVETFYAMDIGGHDQHNRQLSDYQAKELLNKHVIALEAVQLKVRFFSIYGLMVYVKRFIGWGTGHACQGWSFHNT